MDDIDIMIACARGNIGEVLLFYLYVLYSRTKYYETLALGCHLLKANNVSEDILLVIMTMGDH